MVLWFLIAFLSCCISQKTRCNNISDCSYNGLCTNEQCECFPQWKGNHCASLNLIPGSKDHGFNSTVNNSIFSTWGGSVVAVDGYYHMIASEMVQGCGINTWLSNSQIVHAVTSAPSGIGKYQRITINPIEGIFSHEPKIIKALDTEEYVIYFTNQYPPITNKYPCNACTNGATDPNRCHFGVNYTNGLPLIPTRMIYSSNINSSSWSDMIEITTPTPWLDSNLDCYIFVNGSLICLGRSATNGSDLSGYFIEKATHWKDNTTYTYINITDSTLNIKGMHCCGEDPTVWYDTRYDVLHAIWHYNNESNFGFPGGIHTFSSDGGYEWNAFLDFDAYPQEYAYGSYVEYTDGSSQNFTRCERPKLIIADDGFTLLALTNGVQPEKQSDHTYTLLRPVNQKSYG